MPRWSVCRRDPLDPEDPQKHRAALIVDPIDEGQVAHIAVSGEQTLAYRHRARRSDVGEQTKGVLLVGLEVKINLDGGCAHDFMVADPEPSDKEAVTASSP